MGARTAHYLNEQRLAILRVRVAPCDPRRFGDLTYRLAVDRPNVTTEPRRFPRTQTTVAVLVTLAIVAAILIVLLLWPLGRLPWP
jgi:hypothetical protein